MELIHTIVAGVLWPFERLGATVGLALFAAVTGAGLLWVVGKLTPQARLGLVRDRMLAAVYELRLYLDSPRRMLAAQARLMVLSGLYIALLLPALLAVLPLFALFFGPLESRYGLAPLRAGQSAMLRVRLAPTAAGQPVRVVHAAGVRVDAPPVSLDDDRTVYLRLALDGGASRHSVRLNVSGTTIDKTLSVAPVARVDAERRAGLWQLVAAGGEPPLPRAGPIDAIDVLHAPSTRHYAGLAMPWWLYWLALATLAALLLRKPLRVTI